MRLPTQIDQVPPNPSGRGEAGAWRSLHSSVCKPEAPKPATCAVVGSSVVYHGQGLCGGVQYYGSSSPATTQNVFPQQITRARDGDNVDSDRVGFDLKAEQVKEDRSDHELEDRTLSRGVRAEDDYALS